MGKQHEREQHELERPAVPSRMSVGINYMWPFNYCGYTLGPVPYADMNWVGRNPAWRQTLLANLTHLQQMGVGVVRMWILANGYNYGAFNHGKPPLRERLPAIGGKESDKWHFDPPDELDPPGRKDMDGTDRKFETDFKLMMDYFKQTGMKFIPSLLDFAFIEYPAPDDPDKHNYYDPDKKFRPGGRYEIFTDPKKRSKFFETVLDKFLEWSKPYKEQIYAWEVLNEPYWNVQHLKPPPHYAGRVFVTADQMNEFLRLACERIENAKFESTVGHRFYSDCLKHPTGSLAQFHYYYKWYAPGPVNDDPAKIPERATALSEIKSKNPGVKDVFVGEFSIRRPGEYDKDQGTLWSELDSRDDDNTDIVFQRLDWLQRKGYKLALFWPDKNNTAADDLTDKCQVYKFDGVCKFTKRANPLPGGLKK